MVLRLAMDPRAWLVAGLGGYLLLLFVAVLGASYWALPPRWIGLVSEFALFLFLPAPILFLLALLSRVRIAVALSVAPAMLFGVVYGGRFDPTPAVSADPHQQDIVMYSANLARHRGVDLTRLTSLMDSEQPDLVAVQELSARPDRLKEAISAMLPHNTLAPRTDWTGVGLWSRFPILDTQVLKLDDGGSNLSQRVRLDVRGQIVTVYNVHLNAPINAEWESTPNPLDHALIYDARVRRRQVEALIADVRMQEGPLVLVGDFNLTDRTYDHRRLAQVLTDGYASVGWGIGFTFPARRSRGAIGSRVGPYVRIDYVWASPGVSAREVRVVDAVGSDHYGLISRIAVPSRRQF